MVLDRIAWIGVNTRSIHHPRKRRSKRQGSIASSKLDSLDHRLVEDCLEQAGLSDIDEFGESSQLSLDQANGRILGLILLRAEESRPTVAFGEQRAMSISMYFRMLWFCF
jgi:hypothetical protein